MIPREGRQKDALDPIADRPCHKLDERSDVTAIAPVEGSEVLPALAGRDQRSGPLRAVREGGRWYATRGAVDEYLASRR